MWRPLSCGGPWATAQFALSLKSGPAQPCVSTPTVDKTVLSRVCVLLLLSQTHIGLATAPHHANAAFSAAADAATCRTYCSHLVRKRSACLARSELHRQTFIYLPSATEHAIRRYAFFVDTSFRYAVLLCQNRPTVFVAFAWPIMENVTSYTKPQVHDVSKRRQIRTRPRP